VPYTDDDIAGARDAVKGKTEMDALVAYLQGLGTIIKANGDADGYRDDSRPGHRRGDGGLHRPGVVGVQPTAQVGLRRATLPFADDPEAIKHVEQKLLGANNNDYFWSLYVTVLTLGTIFPDLAAAVDPQGPARRVTDETVGHAFDGIEEYDNPLPKWWFWLFVGTIVFALGYLVLYPGLGNWKGCCRATLPG
jgi:hypothetical protein